jgi:hypothetical protein
MRKLWPTLACCVLVTLFVSRRGAGPMLVYVLPFILMSWLLLVAYVAFRRTELRRLQLAKVAIWVVGMATAASAHAYMYEQARQDALRVSTLLKHSRWPKESILARLPNSVSKRPMPGNIDIWQICIVSMVGRISGTSAHSVRMRWRSTISKATDGLKRMRHLTEMRTSLTGPSLSLESCGLRALASTLNTASINIYGVWKS